MKFKDVMKKVGGGIKKGYEWYEENTNKLEQKITRSEKTFDEVLDEKVYEPVKTKGPSKFIAATNTVKNTAVNATNAVKNVRNPDKKSVDQDINKIIAGEVL